MMLGKGRWGRGGRGRIGCRIGCRVGCRVGCRIDCRIGGCRIDCRIGGCRIDCRIGGCRISCRIGGCRISCRIDCRIGCRINGSRSCEACGGGSRRRRRILQCSVIVVIVRPPSLIQLRELLRSLNGVSFTGECSCDKRKQGEDANGVNHFHFGLDLALEFLYFSFRMNFRGKISDLSSE